ncbi:MAG: hypothetical protein ACKVOK_02295 [Flavobacteriales bacterium]
MPKFFFIFLFLPMMAASQYHDDRVIENRNLGVLFNEERNDQNILDTVRFTLSMAGADNFEFYPAAKTTYPDLIALPEKMREGKSYTFEFLVRGSNQDKGLITPVYQEVFLPTKEGFNIRFTYQYVLVHESTERIFKDNKLVEVRGKDLKGFPVILTLDFNEKPVSLGPVSGADKKQLGTWATWKGDQNRPFFEDISNIVYVKANWMHMDSIETFERYSMDGNPKFGSRYKTWPLESLDSAVVWIGDTHQQALIDVHDTISNLYRIAFPKDANRVVLYKGKYSENLRLQLIPQYQKDVLIEIFFSTKKEERMPMGLTDMRFRYDMDRYNLFLNFGEEQVLKYKTEEGYREYLKKKYPKLFFASDNIIDLFNVKKDERKTLITALLAEPGIYKISKCISGFGNSAFSYAFDQIVVYINVFKPTEESVKIAAKYGFTDGQPMFGAPQYMTFRYTGKLLDETFYKQVNALANDPGLFGANVEINMEVELD